MANYLAETVMYCGGDHATICKRRHLCYSKYALKEGSHVLIENGCAPPPLGRDGQLLRNGCDPPVLKSTDEIRTCYCDNRCGFPEMNEEQTNECFINYDETVSPPKLEAGCKDFALELDQGLKLPICGVDTQENWVGSGRKNSCRCETHECNGNLDKLIPKGSEVIEPETGGGNTKFKQEIV